jgi:hypothetical protein
MISPLIPQQGPSNSTGIKTIQSISMKKKRGVFARLPAGRQAAAVHHKTINYKMIVI